ncbi:MAG: cobyrinate a,c-diamide synthase [Rubellimicrobium sp.]|nr:cobyrinate a,c-diamide synthase [Rubellimicrobium sp.]
MLPAGLMISAPASGAGKTTVVLGLLAALRARGLRVQPFKNGPDYIDPAFHEAAAGRLSFNLDSWAMDTGRLARIVDRAAGADLILAEGSMGLFDGVARPGAAGTGASADIASTLGWPVIAVLDVSGQAQSAGAVAAGLARFRPDLRLGGVILNRVASPRHEALVRAGIEAAGLPVLGALPRDSCLAIPERHLGLVQAQEQADLPARLATLGTLVARHADLDAILALAAPTRTGTPRSGTPRSAPVPPPGERIALARDAAFSFAYPHLIADWRAGGATILPFSPLGDQGPDDSATCAWLPGGYPELHAPRLAAAQGFLGGLRRFAQTRPVHGECGGYMVLGAAITAADGTRHAMAGLLGLETDFARRRMHLGYRLARPLVPLPGALGRAAMAGHEFHYATTTAQPDAPLARVTDATGAPVPETGSWRDQPGGARVSGTFFHLIAPADQAPS